MKYCLMREHISYKTHTHTHLDSSIYSQEDGKIKALYANYNDSSKERFSDICQVVDAVILYYIQLM